MNVMLKHWPTISAHPNQNLLRILVYRLTFSVLKRVHLLLMLERLGRDVKALLAQVITHFAGQEVPLMLIWCR